MRASYFAAFAILFQASIAQADLIPRGGEGAQECRNKKAGDTCERSVIEGMEMRHYDGKCVEANFDGIPLKFKAHLRCELPPKPQPSGTNIPIPVITSPPPNSTPPPAPSAAPEPAANQSSCAMGHSPSRAPILVSFAALIMMWRSRHRRMR